MTYGEAKKAGYIDADTTYQRGYVSRKVDIDSQVVHAAGGKRKNDLYVLLPCFNSSQYCMRQYIAKR